MMSKNILSLVEQADQREEALQLMYCLGRLLKEKRRLMSLLTLLLVGMVHVLITPNETYLIYSKIGVNVILWASVAFAILMGLTSHSVIHLWRIVKELRSLVGAKSLIVEINVFIDMIYMEERFINMCLKKNMQKTLKKREKLSLFGKIETIYRAINTLLIGKRQFQPQSKIYA